MNLFRTGGFAALTYKDWQTTLQANLLAPVTLDRGFLPQMIDRKNGVYYGFSIHDDNELFGRLILEINQAGLSWETILKKEQSFRKAYDNFNIKKIAAYTEADRERLLADTGIIRNKLKVNAAIENAKTILDLQKEFGSFEKWLAHHHPKTKEEWVKVFKKNFKFTGGEIVNEFLMSIGYLQGPHTENCVIHKKIVKMNLCGQKVSIIKIQNLSNKNKIT